MKDYFFAMFVSFDSLRPINNLSVIKGQVFLGCTSTKLGLINVLAQGHNTVRLEPAAPLSRVKHSYSDFIWDFGKLPFPTHLGKYFIKIGKIRAKIHKIGKIKAIFGLGMTPIYGLKNGQIKSLLYH